jgi:hypothetical protein
VVARRRTLSAAGLDPAGVDGGALKIGCHIVLPEVADRAIAALRRQVRGEAMRCFGLIAHLGALEADEEVDAVAISCFDTVLLSDRDEDAVASLSPRMRARMPRFLDGCIKPEFAAPRTKALRRRVPFDRGVEAVAGQVAHEMQGR